MKKLILLKGVTCILAMLSYSMAFADTAADANATATVPTTQSSSTSSVAPASDKTIADSSLDAAVQAKIAQTTSLANRTIGVSSRNGAVVLSGNVDTTVEETEAITAAKSVPGVTDVKSNIKVKDKAVTQPSVAK